MSKNIKRKVILALEKGGRIYEGVSCGVSGEKTGWVSFYTGVVGYQEVITTPANTGKIILMTYPLIGNYGVAKKFRESKHSLISGLIIKENTRITSNWQAEKDFFDFLKDEKILAMQGVDTRAIMLELRQDAEQWGIISTKDFNPQSLRRKIKLAKKAKTNFINKISTKRVVKISGRGKTIGIIDIGVTNSLINQLHSLNCKNILIPYKTSTKNILALAARGIIISDGPEIDKGSNIVVNSVKELLGKIPILGIGAGCQILAVALGAKIKKMHIGHHGVNYPVLKPNSLKGKITVQNHSYVIDEVSLDGKGTQVTWRNINDKSIEGIRNSILKAFGYQFYPASPGMGEVNSVLKEFITSLT